MARSCSQPSMIAFNPIVRMRQSKVLYPLSRSPFKYASKMWRSDAPSISLRTILATCHSIVTSLIFRLCHNIVSWLRWAAFERNLMRVV
jgi:hypothetical protein